MPRARTAVMRALVPLVVVTQYLAPINRANCFSASVTTLARDQTPLRSTGSTAFSSVSRKLGQCGKGAVRTGWPPRMAGVPELPVFSATQRPTAVATTVLADVL